MIPFRLSKGDWGTSPPPQPPVCARVDSISGLLEQPIISSSCSKRSRSMRHATVHSRAFLGFFSPSGGVLEIPSPKGPRPALAWPILVNPAALACNKKNAGVVVAADATVEERYLRLTLTPHGARVTLPEIGIAQLVAYCQGCNFRVVDPREPRRAGAAVAAAGA